MTFDLAIIGGGPAGCAAAITAAQRGTNVLLLERGVFPRQKVCGEFVSAESLHLLERLLANDFSGLLRAAPRISSTRVFLDGVTLSARVEPSAASITRFDLDLALWNAAIAAGVTTHTGVAASAIEGQEPFQIVTPNQVFAARSVINAAGRWSTLTNAARRLNATHRKWIGVKAHFYESAPASSTDLYFFNGGYCGVQPVRESTTGSGTIINACAMVHSEVANAIPEVLVQHPLLAERSRGWENASTPVSTAPLIFHAPEPLHGTMLQAGDAAMFVDPFIGDGISLAMRSGVLAADCLVPFFSGISTLGEACDRYAFEYQKRFARIFRSSSRLRQLLQWPPAIRKPALSVLAKAPFLTSQIVRMTR